MNHDGRPRQRVLGRRRVGEDDRAARASNGVRQPVAAVGATLVLATVLAWAVCKALEIEVRGG